MVGSIAHNYARALFELVREEAGPGGDAIERIASELVLARDALCTDKETVAFLASRLISRKAKKGLARAAFSGAVDDRVLTLLYLLIDRGRMKILPEIAEGYELLARHDRGEREVTVRTGFALDEGEKTRVTKALAGHFGSGVVLRVTEDASLIGGVVAESEGHEIELSVQGQLKALAARLAGMKE
jgi:F-type H+-transporting ATPase subunit delta